MGNRIMASLAAVSVNVISQTRRVWPDETHTHGVLKWKLLLFMGNKPEGFVGWTLLDLSLPVRVWGLLKKPPRLC